MIEARKKTVKKAKFSSVTLSMIGLRIKSLHIEKSGSRLTELKIHAEIRLNTNRFYDLFFRVVNTSLRSHTHIRAALWHYSAFCIDSSDPSY